jgi:hypothetical protein
MTFSSDPSVNTNQLPVSLDVNPGEEGFESTLLLYLRRIANATNTKNSGLHLLQETANFEQWFQSSPTTDGSSQQNRNAYRITIDIIALYGGKFPDMTTDTVPLSASTQPPEINGYVYPVQGYGGATDTEGNSYFPSDPNVTISYKSSTNTLTITNNTANELTQLYWVMEYLKVE